MFAILDIQVMSEAGCGDSHQVLWDDPIDAFLWLNVGFLLLTMVRNLQRVLPLMAAGLVTPVGT